MDTKKSNRFYYTNEVGVKIPKPLYYISLLGLLAMIGLLQGSYAWLRAGVPLLNSIVITLIPLLAGAVSLFLILRIAIHYDTKARLASNRRDVFSAAVMVGLVMAMFFLLFPLMFLGSKNVGMPLCGACLTLLVYHWYHLVVAGVAFILFSSGVLWHVKRHTPSAS